MEECVKRNVEIFIKYCYLTSNCKGLRDTALRPLLDACELSGPQMTQWHDCVKTLLNGPKNTSETTVLSADVNWSSIMQNEAKFEPGPEALPCPVDQDPFKIDCFGVGKCCMAKRVLLLYMNAVSSELKGGRFSSILSAFSSEAHF